MCDDGRSGCAVAQPVPAPAGHPDRPEEQTMSKRARRRRSRKGNAANHGNRPNS
jgi:hypothetical protein